MIRDNRIVLGTVQFGLNYGINNVGGKPDNLSVSKILKTAKDLGINILDSADEYGDSLERIAHSSKLEKLDFKIISKVCIREQSFLDELNSCLSRLGKNQIFGYLFHRVSDYYNYDNKTELLIAKEKGLVEKIGVSIYSNSDLEMIVKDPLVDIIQLPFNLFDSDTRKIDLLKEAKERGKEIHVRSIYLQGLFFKVTNSLKGNVKDLKGPLDRIHKIAEEAGLSMDKFCMAYAKSFEFIDKIIIGVDNPEQLVSNVTSYDSVLDEKFISEIQKIIIPDRNLLNPANWRIDV